MEFLVRIQVDLDPNLGAEREHLLRIQEAERASELAREGILVRLWRIPGARANWGLWRAADATELHTVLSSLPLWPWMRTEIHPLARHENDPQSEGS
jgi:muconolactone D-isomerase